MSPCTCHHVVPSCTGGAEALRSAATTMSPSRHPTGSTQPWYLPGTGTGSPIPAEVRTGPAHTSPAGRWRSLLSAGTELCALLPPPEGHSPAQPQAPSGSFCSTGKAPHKVGQPFSSCTAPRAQPCMVQGTACPVPFCPTDIACCIFLCPVSRACLVPRLKGTAGSIPWQSIISLGTALPCPTGTACPVSSPCTMGTTCPRGTACRTHPPQGHCTRRGASWGAQGARGCRCSPRLGARLYWGARGRGAVAAAGPMCRGAGLGCGAATHLWLSPLELHARGLPATYMGRKRRELGCGGR